MKALDVILRIVYTGALGYFGWALAVTRPPQTPVWVVVVTLALIVFVWTVVVLRPVKIGPRLYSGALLLPVLYGAGALVAWLAPEGIQDWTLPIFLSAIIGIWLLALWRPMWLLWAVMGTALVCLVLGAVATLFGLGTLVLDTGG